MEIARALLFDAKLLILDEPTTALNNEEIDRLFMLLRRLRDAGKSFIFISHKMPEIFAISDHYTVLRNGRFIARGAISETNGEALARLMVGESYVSGDLYLSLIHSWQPRRDMALVETQRGQQGARSETHGASSRRCV